MSETREPRDDAGVEDVEELLSELARAAEDGQNSYERGDRLGQREAGNREDEARDAILAIVRAARQRIAAVERAGADVLLAFGDYPEPRPLTEVGRAERCRALNALADAIRPTTPAAPGGATP